jgi:hypothetical protein
MSTKIASSAPTVLTNIHRFGPEVDRSADLQGRLAYVRAWYAHKDADGTWRFGPSKFVGYEDLNAERYMETAKNRDGRRTEAQLRQWFAVVEPSMALYGELSSALFALLAKYGKTPSTMMRLNVLKDVLHEHADVAPADPNDAIVELMIAVAKSLPAVQFNKLQARLGK